jgi:hypothetical protein
MASLNVMFRVAGSVQTQKEVSCGKTNNINEQP